MKKYRMAFYWIATVWLSLGMVSSAIVQLNRLPEEVALFERLGYPATLMLLLGCWKILGVIAILIPRRPLLKEWAYAGFFFSMSGAVVSHLAASAFIDALPALLLLALTVASWSLRPASRRWLNAPAASSAALTTAGER